MLRQKIGIDIDGTLCNIYPEWLGAYNAQFQDNVCVDDFKDYHMAKYAKGNRAIYKVRRPEMYETAQPYDFAVAAVALLAHSYDLVAITHDVEWFVPAKTAWIQRHFPAIQKVLFEQDGHKNNHGVDLLIDDAPHNIELFPNRGVLIDRPWNRSIQPTLDKRHIVCYDWVDIVLKLGVNHESINQ